MNKSFFIAFASLAIILLSCEKKVSEKDTVTLLSVWNNAPHNAFTDLVNYEDMYYCTFRESKEHADYEGKIRVIRSVNLKQWESVALLEVGGKDFRDPHFFIDADNILTLCGNTRTRNEIHENIFYKYIDNEFKKVSSPGVDNDYWLWSFAKCKDTLYSIGYNTLQKCLNALNSPKPKIMLFGSQNTAFTSYNTITPGNWINNNFQCPNEAAMVFTTDSTVVAVVREEFTPGYAHIGKSVRPFTTWEWKKFPHYVRGPDMTLLTNGNIFLSAGSMAEFNKTHYAIINTENLSVIKFSSLESGGDTGYPGVIIEGNSAVISYYSSHEGKSQIYFVRLTLSGL